MEMLQAEGLDGNGGIIGVANVCAEKTDGLGNTFAMMMQRAVREMRKRALARVLLRGPAPGPRGE